MRNSRLAVRLGAGIIVVLAVLSAGLVACGGGDSTTQTDIALTFSEWEISLDPVQVQAGDMTFELNNNGEVPHNLVVVKSDLPPGELPRIDDAVDKSKLNVEGSVGPVAPSTSLQGADGFGLALSAGKYVLFCDVVANGESHYRNGMYASLLVEP